MPEVNAPISETEIVTLIAREWLTEKGVSEETAADLSDPEEFPLVAPEDWSACTTIARALLHRFDTALATAVARARRETLEEAKTACLDLSDAYRETGEHHMGVGPQGAEPILTKAAEALAWARGATECAHALTKLAATPPEARQTETGWKPPAGWKLVPVEPTEQMDAAARIMCHQMSGVIDPVVHVWDAMLAASPPPPAIGNLEGEGRS